MEILMYIVLAALLIYFFATWRMTRKMNKEYKFMKIYYPVFIKYLSNKGEIDKELNIRGDLTEAEREVFFSKFKEGHMYTDADMEKCFNAGANLGVSMYENSVQINYKNYNEYIHETKK
jgi:uncharacterized protein (DUF169 family)